VEASVHQLLGDWFSVGARYRVSDARLRVSYPQVNPALGVTSSTSQGLLHVLSLDGMFQHPSGFFAGVEEKWWAQTLGEDLAGTPGDHFWQTDLIAGYRSPRRHVEFSVGLLNLTGQDYHLHPINLYPDLPRQRTFVTRLQFNF
jgi:hypothetical protein